VRVLITGGAGFIGSHLADHLLAHGHGIRVLDSLVEQVHPDRNPPEYLSADVELVRGDVRDAKLVERVTRNVDAVIHLAARVGVGQSMYEMAEYTSANSLGTAVLLEQLAARPVERLVVASSMSIYGEGQYVTRAGVPVASAGRTLSALRRAQWEPLDADGVPLTPVATPESKPPALSSIYALGKYDQERACLMVGEAYQIPSVALRLFNTYGTRQSLSNPYTGVLAIFASRLLNGRAPMIFEDGQQQRDFVHVSDVVRAFRLALETPAARVSGGAFNVGSGRAYTVAAIAHVLAKVIGVDVAPEINGRYRVGDVRHCFADLTLVREAFDYTPAMPLDQGVQELGEWLAEQSAEDHLERASAELSRRGLTV